VTGGGDCKFPVNFLGQVSSSGHCWEITMTDEINQSLIDDLIGGSEEVGGMSTNDNGVSIGADGSSINRSGVSIRGGRSTNNNGGSIVANSVSIGGRGSSAPSGSRAASGSVRQTDIKSVLKSIQKFDGKSDVGVFCDRCDAVIAAASADVAWIIFNFHQLIEGEVHEWWKFSQRKFISGDAPTVRWEQLKTELKKFYDPDSLRKEARRQAKTIYYVDCASAGEYVSKKLGCFSVIDSEMSDKKQVEKLIKGLPYAIKNIMYGCEPKSANEFLQKLRKMGKPDFSKAKTGKPESSDRRQGGSGGVPSRPKPAAPSSDSERRQSQRARESRPFNGTCYRCREKGHLSRDCPQNKEGEGQGSSKVFGVSGETTQNQHFSKNE
jgi:hypothetical protein